MNIPVNEQETVINFTGEAGIEKDYQTATGGEVVGTDPNRGRNERIYHCSDKGAGGMLSGYGTKTGASYFVPGYAARI